MHEFVNEVCPAIVRVWRDAVSRDEAMAAGAVWRYDPGDVLVILPTKYAIGFDEFPEDVPTMMGYFRSADGSRDSGVFDIPVSDWAFIEAHSDPVDKPSVEEVAFFLQYFDVTLVPRSGAPTEADAKAREEDRAVVIALSMEMVEAIEELFGISGVAEQHPNPGGILN